MGKASRIKREKKVQQPLQEGLISVRFIFDGKEYSLSHQLNGQEIKRMKQVVEEHGDAAAGSAHWRVALWGAGMLGEKMMMQAARDYMKRHRIAEEGAASSQELTESEKLLAYEVDYENQKVKIVQAEESASLAKTRLKVDLETVEVKDEDSN